MKLTTALLSWQHLDEDAAADFFTVFSSLPRNLAKSLLLNLLSRSILDLYRILCQLNTSTNELTLDAYCNLLDKRKNLNSFPQFWV